MVFLVQHKAAKWMPDGYLTAPKVMPCTSCFWLNQPNTTMGAMAISEAAESLAQNSPSGLAYEAISVASVPATLIATYADRKSTRLNSSHSQISYAVFCLKKKKTRQDRFCDNA